MKIVIEVPDHNIEDLEGLNEHDLRLLMLDALYEFQAHRGPTPEAYVEKRYSPPDAYSWMDRQEKIQSVRWRNHVANVLHGSIWSGVKIVKD